MSRKKKKVSNLPKLNQWVNAIAAQSDHPFVRDATKSISYCFELRQCLPKKYGWRRINSESFGKLVASQNSPEEINRLFWKDQARNVEAYGLLSYWRGLELLETTVRSLNLKQVISAAVLARSTLELASAFLLNSNKIEATLKDLEFPENTLVSSEEFETAVVKMIWGTRLGEHEPYLSQKSILTTIQKLSKNPDITEFTPRYEYLCELAHPNFIGNARFWTHIDERHADGSETVALDQRLDDGIAADIVENTLWAISWSSVCIRNSFYIAQSGVDSVLGKLAEQ